MSPLGPPFALFPAQGDHRPSLVDRGWVPLVREGEGKTMIRCQRSVERRYIRTESQEIWMTFDQSNASHPFRRGFRARNSPCPRTSVMKASRTSGKEGW